MITLYLKLLLVAFLINLVWEICHSPLYTTCRNMNMLAYRKLMLNMSAKDSLWITLIYSLTVIFLKNLNIINNKYQLLAFIILGLLFSFTDEKISLKRKRWQYTRAMPRVFGAGITPLLEITITGLLTFFIIFS